MSTFTYASANTVAQAAKADATIADLWAKAYADAARDIERGGDLRGMADAITKAGTKCSKDTAGDYVLAHSLTVHGVVFADALAARIGEGKVMRAHSLIAKARKARGVAYVRSVLASLDVEDTDALTKAMGKAVRDLDAAKREPSKVEGETVEGEGVESGEGETVEGVETVVPTVDAMLASVMGPTAKLVELIESGEFPTDADALDRWLTAVARIARAAKAAKAAA